MNIQTDKDLPQSNLIKKVKRLASLLENADASTDPSFIREWLLGLAHWSSLINAYPTELDISEIQGE